MTDKKSFDEVTHYYAGMGLPICNLDRFVYGIAPHTYDTKLVECLKCIAELKRLGIYDRD